MKYIPCEACTYGQLCEVCKGAGRIQVMTESDYRKLEQPERWAELKRESDTDN